MSRIFREGSLFNEVKPIAQNILAELAKKPEGYRRRDLVGVLGIEEPAMRGQLSSVGAALRRMDNKPSLISKKKIEGDLTYKLNPAVANMFRVIFNLFCQAGN